MLVFTHPFPQFILCLEQKTFNCTARSSSNRVCSLKMPARKDVSQAFAKDARFRWDRPPGWLALGFFGLCLALTSGRIWAGDKIAATPGAKAGDLTALSLEHL